MSLLKNLAETISKQSGEKVTNQEFHLAKKPTIPGTLDKSHHKCGGRRAMYLFTFHGHGFMNTVLLSK